MVSSRAGHWRSRERSLSRTAESRSQGEPACTRGGRTPLPRGRLGRPRARCRPRARGAPACNHRPPPGCGSDARRRADRTGSRTTSFHLEVAVRRSAPAYPRPVCDHVVAPRAAPRAKLNPQLKLKTIRISQYGLLFRPSSLSEILNNTAPTMSTSENQPRGRTPLLQQARARCQAIAIIVSSNPNPTSPSSNVTSR